ncbi:MAG TPA: glycosyltransferase family 2 protein [Burkholderiales bacterium]|jgi:glycosyltransferase involved in cell wall biosynthesis
MRTAVIITTYNTPKALAAVLEGYLAQDAHDFELIVADDGSTDDTRRVIEDYARRAQFPLHHVWQEDRGFRAAAARNRALAAARADYIIFSDGDCVPSRHFVATHRRLAEPGRFLAGNRVLLSARLTERVLRERLPIHEWSRWQWLQMWATRDAKRIWPLLILPDGDFRKVRPRRWYGVKTCNLSAWRSDLAAVNGLDETYTGWGLEDSDLVIRLLHAGVLHKSARFATPVFHLWHRESDRGRLPANQRLLDDLVASLRTRAPLGLDQYL